MNANRAVAPNPSPTKGVKLMSKPKVTPAPPGAQEEQAPRTVPLSLRDMGDYVRHASQAELAQLLAVLGAEVQRRTDALHELACALQVEPTVTPEQTLRAAGIGSKRQAAYQRKMSALLAGRNGAGVATEAK
jgi:hypothetical protein